ncbi:hypothetical protein TrCOL_g698 [Triparma columacea]|uniref:Uncharacterized protein n=1 Tax=Triparma columacea TaxID=722753 RepID=A0A9W7GL05_9STRA|nr:hypothetical protein TrCOL_g698 [Triparma columacea]
MKIIILNIAFLLLALTKDLNTASADNLRAPEAEGPTQTDISDGLTIHVENGQVHRKLKGKGKGKGKFQSCQDMSGKWLFVEPLTTYFSDDRVPANVNIAFELISASDTLCNYFGKEYGTGSQNPFRQAFATVALTTFPGYLGAKEGDNLFLSFAGEGKSAPANVEVCVFDEAFVGLNPTQTAKFYIDAFCYVSDDGQNVCTSKSVVNMAKFPDSATQIVGKTHAQLMEELKKQTDFKPIYSC